MTRSTHGVVRALPAALLSVLALAASASAGTSVSINIRTISIDEELVPGATYMLPTFDVRNPGSETTTYEMRVSAVSDPGSLSSPSNWFEFRPSTITLEGGASQSVSSSLTIPADAEAGEYRALIGPQIAVATGEAQVGAGVAANVRFSVLPASWLDGVVKALVTGLERHPWVVVAVLMVALLVAGTFIRRRYAINVVRR